MKRLVWLLLLAFGTLLTQVSPVEPPVTKHQVCHCCKHAGDCGMPDCVPPPVTAQPTVCHLSAPARVARVAVQRAAPAPRGMHDKFYVQFLPRAIMAPALSASVAVTPAASVPLFREHCSLLL